MQNNLQSIVVIPDIRKLWRFQNIRKDVQKKIEGIIVKQMDLVQMMQRHVDLGTGICEFHVVL